MEALEQKVVRSKADTQARQPSVIMESQEKTPMLTHHQSNVVKLVVWVAFAVTIAAILQVFK